MTTGLVMGGTGGLVVGGLVVANIIGFPEVEGGEATLAVLGLLGGAGGDVVVTGGFVGALWGSGTGMIVGLVATPPSCDGGGGL